MQYKHMQGTGGLLGLGQSLQSMRQHELSVANAAIAFPNNKTSTHMHHVYRCSTLAFAQERQWRVILEEEK